MVSFCVFELESWSKGIATAALKLFIEAIRAKYGHDALTTGTLTKCPEEPEDALPF